VLCGSERCFVEARFTNCAASLLLSFAESTAQQVADWAQEVVGLDQDDAQVLLKNKLTGSRIFKMAKQPQKELEEKLVKAPYFLSGGGAVDLAEAISSLGANAQGERGSGGVCCVELMCCVDK
jgi:hypothetical protein